MAGTADLAELIGTVTDAGGSVRLAAAMTYQHAAERRDAEVAERLGRLAAGTRANRTGTQRARRGR